MKKHIILALSILCFFNAAAIFESFNYLDHGQFKQMVETNTPLLIVDIQVEKEFAEHHFQGSIETNAYPVKTEDDRKKIDAAVAAYKKTGFNIVVVCPRGGGGAKRCYSYLKSQGIPDEKLAILKGGIEKFPYRDLLVKN